MTSYNSIDPIRIADNIIVDIFTKAYEEIYGSIIDGISHQSDMYGNEWEVKEIVEPVKIIKQIDNSKEIESLLRNEGSFSDVVCIDYRNESYERIYGQLKTIYACALHVTINDRCYEDLEPVIDLKMLPEEYMAYQYDFFEIYNAHERIKEKYKLREEIIYTSQAIVEELKERIGKIVHVYEVEQI